MWNCGSGETRHQAMPVGQRIVLENEHVRVWEINLGLGRDDRLSYSLSSYLVISLGCDDNEIETILGHRIKTVEEPRLDSFHQ